MKHPVMAFIRAALSALPSFLRRSSAAIAVGLVLLVGVGVMTGIIPNIIAALQSQSRTYRDNAKAEEIAATYANEQAKAIANAARIHREASEAEAEIFEEEIKAFKKVPASEIISAAREQIYPQLSDQIRPTFSQVFEDEIHAVCSLECTQSDIIKLIKTDVLRNSNKSVGITVSDDVIFKYHNILYQLKYMQLDVYGNRI